MKQMKFGLEGFYKIEAVKANGERRLLLDWFNNLILDAGLNRLGSGGAFNRCMVGTSSTAVLPGQTTLGAQIASTTTIEASSNGVNLVSGYAWARRTFRFAVGTATGNITEVGVGWTATECFSRALTTDGGGDPVTITVLADEFLDVTYELRMHWPTVDISINGFVSSTEHSVVTRAAQVGSWSLATLIENGSRSDLTPPGQAFSYGAGALGDITLDAGGTPLNNVNMTYAAPYVNNSLERLYRATFGLPNGDVDITNIKITTPFGNFKSSFSPVIAKRNTNSLSLDYRVSWSRRVPFSGVNPTIGTLSASASVESPGEAITTIARVEFRPDGSIFSVVSNGIGTATLTTKIGEWHIPNTAGVGAGFEVQFAVASGTGGTLDNSASSYSGLGSLAAFVSLFDSTTGNYTHTRAITYNVRAAGGGSVLATGTINLSITRINA